MDLQDLAKIIGLSWDNVSHKTSMVSGYGHCKSQLHI